MKENGTVTMVDRLPNCDFRCSGTTHEATYDGKTTGGPWAYMCDEAFQNYGVGLGEGRGQKMRLR